MWAMQSRLANYRRVLDKLGCPNTTTAVVRIRGTLRRDSVSPTSKNCGRWPWCCSVSSRSALTPGHLGR